MHYSAESSAGPPGPGSTRPLLRDRRPPGPRVFLTDDNAALRATLRDLFADTGIEVVGEAGDGAEALRAIPLVAGASPLVVVMDVRMPGPINGIEATRLLTARRSRAAVIVLTAFPGAGIEQAAREAGAVDVVAKGAPIAELARAVERAWLALAFSAS